MIRLNDRQTLAHHVRQAQAAGARLHTACALTGIDIHTPQRLGSGVQASRTATGVQRLRARRPPMPCPQPNGHTSRRMPINRALREAACAHRAEARL
jgi:hypothetical protein